MKNLLESFQAYFSRDVYYQVRILKLFLYSWVIFNTLVLSFKGEYFWGELAFPSTVDFHELSFLSKSVNLLEYGPLADWYPIFIFLQVMFCLLTLANWGSFLPPLLVLLLTFNLDNKIAVTLDGGNNIMHLMLVYAVFMGRGRSYLGTYLNNFSLFLARAQLCLVYFVAGHMKLAGELWVNGTALYYTFNVEEYSHPLLQSLVMELPFISVFGSYITLAFQLSFPFLIWVPRLRPFYFFVGTILHLGISLGMGLVAFGLAMIACYSAFFSRQKAYSLYLSIFSNTSLIVGIDSHCKVCQKFGRLIQRVNIFNKIIIDDARTPNAPELMKVPLEKRVSKIYIYDPARGSYHSGMAAIAELLKGSIFFPISFLLQVLNFLGVGEPLYQRYIARGTFRIKCIKGECVL